MKVLYHIPSLDSIYAQRTIFHGFKNAFVDLGHEFRALTADDDLERTLLEYAPDLFITATHHYYRRYLDFDLLREARLSGLFVLAKVDFWTSPLAGYRINEAGSMKDDRRLVELMANGIYADAYFHVVEQEDRRMDGFRQETGYPYWTVPLAADKTLLKPIHDERFAADVSYIGSALPEKRAFFRQFVFPLRKELDLKIYGQDWTTLDRALGWVQRAGQYLNIKPLARVRKPKLFLEDEARIYASTRVAINVHEEFQRNYGGDCNERTFKIPLCGGFEIVDSVACIKKYFDCGRELVLAETPKEWMDKVRHFVAHPDERLPYIEAGRVRVLKDHTYHNRVDAIIDIMNRSPRH